MNPFRRSALPRLFGSLVLFILALVASTRATTVRPPTFPELVGRAEFVAETTVKSLRSEFVYRGADRAISTFVTFTTREAIKGAVPAEFTLEFMGGSVGEEAMEVEGMPRFEPGQHDVVFVEKRSGQLCPLVTLGYGRYRVYTDASSSTPLIARDNGVPLEDVSEVNLPMPTNTALVSALSGLKRGPLTLAAFAARIRDTASEIALQHQP